MGNEVSVIQLPVGAPPRTYDVAPDERRADTAALTAAAQGAIGEVRAALAAWPTPEGTRYAGQAAMVRAADQLLAAICADMTDALEFERPVERVVLPAYGIEWIANAFDAYAHDLCVIEHTLAEAQTTASARIAGAVQTAELRLELYRRYVVETSSDYRLRQSRVQRKRRRNEPMSSADRAALLARIQTLRDSMRPEIHAAVDALLEGLRGGANAERLLQRFRGALRSVQLNAALADCIVLLAQAEAALVAADDEGAARPPPAKVARAADLA